MPERWIRIFVPGFLVTYAVIGFSLWVTYRPEVYPVSAWGMFQMIPKKVPALELMIYRSRGVEFDPPIAASDPDNAAGLSIRAHQKLVLNGYARFAVSDSPVDAERYRAFIDQHIVGPDSRYEVLRIIERSRPHEQHLVEVETFGPFVTTVEQPPPDPEARLEFGGRSSTERKFGMRKNKGGPREKRRKSAL